MANKPDDEEATTSRNEWREPIRRAEVNSWLRKHGLRER